jgi:hypothetical protein
VSITFTNQSDVTVFTQEPAPGFVYAEDDSFATRGFAAVPGAFRVGVDFEKRTGANHPYRWGLGKPLAPGETRTIAGAIRLNASLRPRAQKYWGGLVREQVAWLEDQRGAQTITVKKRQRRSSR